jgi:hypothetical protein
MINHRGCKSFGKSGLLIFMVVSLACGRPTLARGMDVAISDAIVILASPVIMTLRIGSSGSTIDRVTFPVTGIPGSGAVAGTSTGTNPVPFQASGRLTGPGTVSLTANSSQPLINASGNSIPFNQISWQGSGDLASGRFNGTANQLILQRSTGTTFNNISGTMAFSYDNTLFVPSGTYSGRVTYTLSAL